MNLKKLEGAVGLAIRAGKCVQGTDACERAVRSGKAKLLLVDPAASDNLKKDTENLCAYYHCPREIIPEAGWLELVTGAENRRTLAITDTGFAGMIRKHFQE